MALIISILVLIPLFMTIPVTFASDDTIDVLIGKNLREVTVSGVDLQRKLYASKNVWLLSKKIKNELNQNVKAIRFKCHGGNRSNRAKGRQSGALAKGKQNILALITSPSKILTWNRERYKGDFLVIGTNKQGRCDLVNRVSIEHYISVILPKEMHASWPIEALKAQAVASRSYAFYKMRSRVRGFQENENITFFDIENSERHQVSGSLLDETSNTASAAKNTAGEVLSFKGKKFVPIYFHAKCGGSTLLPEDVWEKGANDKNTLGYHRVDCPFCQGKGVEIWKLELNKKDFYPLVSQILKSKGTTKRVAKGVAGTSGVDFSPDKMRPDNINIKIITNKIDSTSVDFILQNRKKHTTHLFSVKKSFIRKYWGYDKVYSNRFIIENGDGRGNNNKLTLKGSGKGHGVGLCQMGALELAKRGWSYSQILKYYFPEHVIVNYSQL
ncbi:MAG: SpoIID/LytB domain-containing protein [Oligoflexia bacterium]|nr:SpoIID/LytB domain-containing protein [Oligoflexia bacterium]